MAERKVASLPHEIAVALAAKGEVVLAGRDGPFSYVVYCVENPPSANADNVKEPASNKPAASANQSWKIF